MSKLSKKQISKIEAISIFTDVIKAYDSDKIAGVHWIDTPPDMWCDKDRTKIYDMMNELEAKLKEKILHIVSDSKNHLQDAIFVKPVFPKIEKLCKGFACYSYATGTGYCINCNSRIKNNQNVHT